MELTIALALSILSSVIAVSSFVLSRKDKAVKDVKEAEVPKVPKGKKVVVNGKIYIQGEDGHTYDMSSRRVK